MGFMDRLRENPGMRGSNGIYGMSQPENDNDVLSIVNKLRDRDMQDYRDKATFDDERSLRQEQRLRGLFDPSKHLNIQDMPHTPTQNIMNPETVLDLQLRSKQPELDVEKQKIASQNRFGQEKLNIQEAQQKLNETKNTQINEDRDAERQRKVEEANNKIKLAQDALADKTKSSENQLQAHKDMAAAIEERHKLELENKQHEFNTTTDLHKQQIAALEKQIADKAAQVANSETTTTISPDEKTKTVTTKKGDAATKVQVLGKDGKTYTIPKDKLDDKDADGTPHWKPVGGGV